MIFILSWHQLATPINIQDHILESYAKNLLLSSIVRIDETLTKLLSLKT